MAAYQPFLNLLPAPPSPQDAEDADPNAEPDADSTITSYAPAAAAAYASSVWAHTRDPRGLIIPHSAALLPSSTDTPPSIGTAITLHPDMFHTSTSQGEPGVAAAPANALVHPLIEFLTVRDPHRFPRPRPLPASAALRPARSPLLFIDVALPEERVGVSRRNVHEGLLVAHICSSLLGLLPGMFHTLSYH
jgi:hypothetical protein